MHKEAIKNLVTAKFFQNMLQNQFQRFSVSPIYKDSTWSLNLESEIDGFPIKNNLVYKLANIEKTNGDYICTIEPNLSVDFINKELKDKQVTIKLMDDNIGGRGKVIYNLSKGCIVSKNTTTDINYEKKITINKGKSFLAKERSTLNVNVTLL